MLGCRYSCEISAAQHGHLPEGGLLARGRDSQGSQDAAIVTTHHPGVANNKDVQDYIMPASLTSVRLSCAVQLLQKPTRPHVVMYHVTSTGCTFTEAQILR